MCYSCIYTELYIHTTNYYVCIALMLPIKLMYLWNGQEEISIICMQANYLAKTYLLSFLLKNFWGLYFWNLKLIIVTDHFFQCNMWVLIRFCSLFDTAAKYVLYHQGFWPCQVHAYNNPRASRKCFCQGWCASSQIHHSAVPVHDLTCARPILTYE